MCAYQMFQLVPEQQTPNYACGNSLTLTTILRNQWGFKGFVLSDYGATHATDEILSGLDQEYPDASGGFSGPYFGSDLKPFVDPTSKRYSYTYAQAFDRAVADVLYAYQRFGLLKCASPSGAVPGCKLPPRPSLNRAADAAVSLRLSEEAAVLLKNAGNALPLTASNLKNGVAVIGPTGRQLSVDGNQGERARGFPDRNKISPLQAIKALAPAGSRITYSPGIDWVGSVVPASALKPGLTRTESDSKVSRVDSTIDYPKTGSLKPGVTYTWKGKLTAPAAGMYYLWLQQSYPSGGGFFAPPSTSVKIDGVAANTFSPPVKSYTYPNGAIPAAGENNGVDVHLAAGAHTIEISTTVDAAATKPVMFRFAWSSFNQTLADAVKAAKSARVAVVFADDNGGNGGTASTLTPLADNEGALIAAVAKANPNTVVVLSTSNPVPMPWLSTVKSVLEMWYPGQEGGTSTANILLGKYNPSGHLPITFPKSWSQTPFANHPAWYLGAGGKVTFGDGIYVGYRWYDHANLDLSLS